MQKTILVAGENTAQLYILKQAIVEKFCYNASICTNANQAFTELFSSDSPTPDLVLLDLGKESNNWLKLIHDIRKKSADFPIIILTEYGEHEFATQAIKAGADDFLTKPVATARLGLSIFNAMRLCNLQKTIVKLEQRLAMDRVFIHQPKQSELSTLSPVDANGTIKKLQTIEEEAIRLALKTAGNSMSKAARMLGIGRSTLYRKVGELEASQTQISSRFSQNNISQSQISHQISLANHTTRPTISTLLMDFS